MKKIVIIAMLILSLIILSSCETVNYVNDGNIVDNKLPEAENTVFAEVASEYMEKLVTANLYFAYKDQNLLAAETREIKVKSDEIPELSIIKELIAGPKQSNGNLVNLFSQEIKALNAVPLNDNKILAITFSEEFLNINNGNKEERQLVLDSIAATITDNYPYLGIQIFIKPEDENAYRLNSSFLFDEKGETLPPISRNDSNILTPRKSADKLIKAWINLDY
ncbi:MAG: GerMN domain-containing protein, partial [Christensenellaceae bacterium]|nr:GerMN domain-containing protein [Christensenellaceae bacterium]